MHGVSHHFTKPYVCSCFKTQIPSVFATRKIKELSLTYSDPTRVAIRSLKHDKADAFSGFDDLNFILSSPNFESFLKLDGKVKPIWIFTRDAHDGPPFPTARKALIKFCFKENDVDYIVAVCNASGLSAYHFIERRMASLTKELAGVILSHDSYGSHLDGNGKTMDGEKELQNFKKADETLVEI